MPRDDATADLLRYHAELTRMGEGVRRTYSRYLPLFLLCCAETMASLVAFAMKASAEPALLNWEGMKAWLFSQPFLYLDLAALPPLFALGYLVLLAVMMPRERFYEERARVVRDEIEGQLQARNGLALRREPVEISLLDRVISRPALASARPPAAPTREPRLNLPPAEDGRSRFNPPSFNTPRLGPNPDKDTD